MFTKEEFDKLTKIPDGEPVVVQAKILATNLTLHDTHTLSSISKDIIAKAKDDATSVLPDYKNFNLIVYADKATNKVQFLWEINELYRYDDLKQHNMPTVDELKKSYFETSYASFANFIKLQ